MRLYLPVTLAEIDALPTSGPVTITLVPRRAHTATRRLVAELTAEGLDDVEEAEFVAQLAAADDSLVAIAAEPSVPWLRTVLSVDVPDDAVRDLVDDESPSAVEITRELSRTPVVCVHVDEPEASADIQAVLGGDDAAIERLADRDLLWYDVSELGAIPR